MKKNDDIVAVANTIKRKFRSEGKEVPRFVNSILLNKGQITDFPTENQQILLDNGYEPPQQLATGGSIISPNIKEPFHFNEFNEGGLHETNKHGGIPQGQGANGKMNTVEEGETSMTTPDGKFIFSHRLGLNSDSNQYVNGGIVDPPAKEKTVQESKEFVKNWFNDPETKARYSMNMAQGFGKTLPKIEEGLRNIDSAKVEYNSPTSSKSAQAGYKNNTISFYTNPTESTATHEYAHAMGLDKDLTNYIRNNYGTPAKAIQDKTGMSFKDAIKDQFSIDDSTFLGKDKLQGTINHSRYLSENGELYPRIMEMRKVLNVKPGEIITDDQIKKLKTTDNPLFKYYSDDQIKSILNTVADNSKSIKKNNLV